MTAKRHEIARRLQDQVLRVQDGSVQPGASDWHRAVGLMVHRGAGELACERTRSPSDLAGVVTEWVSANARDTRAFGNLAKARAQITGCICIYLRTYAPGPDAEHLGCEIRYDVDGVRGTVDLAWALPGMGVVIDEIKTQSWVNLAVDDRTLDQAQRYRRFGVSRWGGRFVGVRFLPLRFPSETRLVTATGAVVPLNESPALSTGSVA